MEIIFKSTYVLKFLGKFQVFSRFYVNLECIVVVLIKINSIDDFLMAFYPNYEEGIFRGSDNS